MAKTALIEKAKRTPKFKVRGYNRCGLCGRSRGYMRTFAMCRICLEKMHCSGCCPGLRKRVGNHSAKIRYPHVDRHDR